MSNETAPPIYPGWYAIPKKQIGDKRVYTLRTQNQWKETGFNVRKEHQGNPTAYVMLPRDFARMTKNDKAALYAPHQIYKMRTRIHRGPALPGITGKQVDHNANIHQRMMSRGERIDLYREGVRHVVLYLVEHFNDDGEITHYTPYVRIADYNTEDPYLSGEFQDLRHAYEYAHHYARLFKRNPNLCRLPDLPKHTGDWIVQIFPADGTHVVYYSGDNPDSLHPNSHLKTAYVNCESYDENEHVTHMSEGAALAVVDHIHEHNPEILKDRKRTKIRHAEIWPAWYRR